jgi:hypothetical protein
MYMYRCVEKSAWYVVLCTSSPVPGALRQVSVLCISTMIALTHQRGLFAESESLLNFGRSFVKYMYRCVEKSAWYVLLCTGSPVLGALRQVSVLCIFTMIALTHQRGLFAELESLLNCSCILSYGEVRFLFIM